MKFSLKQRLAGALAFGALAISVPHAQASSHREALAILNEPCADNTDTYAWVSNATHDKLYLIMDFNPLHEPGQGNQGFRACNGYRYEFHIGKGTSLKDEAVYRIEFKNTLTPSPAPGPTDALGGGNELLWQLTGGTETMTVTRIMAPGNPNPVVLGENLKVLPNNHGPQTDRLIYGLGPFKGYDSGDPTSRDHGLYDQTFVDTYIQTLTGGARIIAGDFDDPYQLDEKGHLRPRQPRQRRSGRNPGSTQHTDQGCLRGLQRLCDRARDPDRRHLPAGYPAQWHAQRHFD